MNMPSDKALVLANVRAGKSTRPASVLVVF